MSDPEIDAMSTIATALTDLEENARERVLRWAAARYGVTLPGDGHRGGGTSGGSAGNDDSDGGGDAQASADEEPSYEHFAELFAATSPKNNEDKTLVAAYWVQIHEGQNQWQSRRLNAELKHLGHAIPNITMALTSSMRRKPQRVIQLKKSGSAQQANKTYKVTSEGIAYVQGMLGSGSA
jgi:hypothetical protein